MNGLLNIQVRVLSREAQALLKQLEKEIAAVDKATNGQSTASKRLAISQENARNQTRALSAATRELAAAQRAVATAQRAAEASTAKVATKQAAYRQALIASTNASAKLKMMDANSAARHAASAAAIAAETRALRAQTVAQNNVKKAKIVRNAAREAKNVDASQPNLDRLKKAELSLANAKLVRKNATDAVIKASTASAASEAKAAQAAYRLAMAEQEVTLAQQRAAAAAAELTAAHGRLGATDAEISAAATRAAAAQSKLAAAEERATVATAAASKAQLGFAASMGAAAAASGRAAAGGFAKATSAFTNMANKTQWAGRQLQTNFTLPILLAGGFAVKFALDNEKAFTKLAKVYGDDPTKDYGATLDKLRVSMRLLSEKFGVQQKDVTEIGAAWAAAGAQGESLAKGVQQTLRTMVVGELDAVEATKALISIQAQWGLNSDELASTMNMLNTVENQSAVNLKDLVDAYARASGSAKNAGVTQEQLAVDIAALVPAAGSAAAAGNGLKTIYSKLLAPTSDAVDIMHKLGIETNQSSWNSLTASDRLKTLAEAYKGATRGQRSMADAVIFGRYQLNRASVLLDAVADKEGARTKLLDQITDKTHNLAVADKELQKVMESNPQKLKQLGVIAQNVAADLGTKMIPAVMALASTLTSLFKKFNALDPSTRKMIVALLIFMAVLGPLMRWLGALGTLIGWVGKMMVGFSKAAMFTSRAILTLLIAPFMMLSKVLIGSMLLIGRTAAVVRLLPAAFVAARSAVIAFFTAFRFLAAMTGIWSALLGVAGAGMAGLLAIVRTGLIRVGSLLIGWPGLILIAVVAAVVLLKDQIAGVFHALGQTLKNQAGIFSAIGNNIIGAFHKLPAGIQSAMLAVVKIVAAAARAVYKLFSYLNPFAHHSPSLVENVTNGMAAVATEFGKLPSTVGVPIKKAYADIAKFKNATKDLMAGFDKMSQKKDYESLLKVDSNGAAAYKVLAADLAKLNPQLDALEAKQKAQQQVVDAWKDKVNAATDALDAQDQVLDKLKNTADGWNDKMQAAQQTLDNLTSTPITGYKAMENAIFDNEMAQKALQLQMMQMEDAVGPIEDLQSKMASLQGAIEAVRGEQADLRSAGAGGDILATYDAQITALEQQQGAIGDTASQYNDLQIQLDALARAGQKLDLEKSLNFDGLQKQIQDAASSIHEMDFADIIAGVVEAKTQVDYYNQKLDGANAAVDAQQKIVDSLKAKRDALQLTYDAEQKKLDAITASYEKLRDVVDEIKQAMSDVASVSSQVVKNKNGGGLSPAEQSFADAGTGDFPVQGGSAGINGGIGDLDKFNKDLESQMKDLNDQLDMFGPIKKSWGKLKKWWSTNVVSGVKALFKQLKPGTDYMSPLLGNRAQYEDTPFMTSLKEIPTRISEIFHSPGMVKAGDVIKSVIKGIGDVVKLFLPDLKDLALVLRDNVVKAFKTWWPEIQKLLPAIGRLVKLIGFILAPVLAAILLVIKILANVFTEVLGRALGVVINLIGDAIQILTGLINFVVGVFTGDWKLAWEGVKQVFVGIFEAIWHFLEGIVSIVWGVIKGFVEGIVGFFTWLWDVLVGHSIIPDMCNAIVDWFLGLPGRILGALATLGGKLVALIQAAWGLFMAALNAAWTGTWNFIKSLPQKIYDAFMLGASVIGSIGGKIIGWIKDGLVNAWGAVTGWIGTSVNWVVDKFGSIKSGLANKFSGMFDGIKDAFRSAINFIIRGWNSLDFHVPEVDTHLPGVGKVGGWSIGVPDIPYLAKGGTARAGELNIIGEVGPELFVPGQTGRVFSHASMQDLVNTATKDALSMLAGAGVGATVRSAVPGQYAAMAAGADRRVSMVSGGAAPVQSASVTNNTEYHFHGDLSFPNIKSGEDAEMFLTNLSDLAG